MTASVLDGKQLSSLKRNEIKLAIEAMANEGYRAPGLAVILVGNDPASEIYVANKQKACQEVGIKSWSYNLSADTTEQELVDLINKLNNSPDIDGILVQLPLPKSMNTHHIIECIHPHKDIDGFHPYNVGRLSQRLPLLRPCTPYGIIQLLEAYNIPLKGMHAVVVGASNIVGRPMALELLAIGSTVTVCHRFTRDLEKHVRSAELLVVATGRRNIISTEWLHSGQIVVDVGIHRLPNGKLTGDVNFDEAAAKVAWITPVPGGVGPMTITTLLQNTLFAAQKNLFPSE
ncbi:bifunctional methylenetetrahydrofolate dehydrogenase/methenyltetrahydrofolate cyclohydrolase FolD [Legionella spiritensis]|uniref:bifunctional methylenetetrahydrofolate dehydrogenase/methenyltetrahydrofolate cyclohydrolase FolD n=1 Tax=Legionella spiritensis TaxID=452 RepID=UPI000F6D4A14|nr:bifunctional methylenetetrahydrofolate dehydrogenase/methenyltetrahydrofolate cyclohydrolase FolD [Legionella spiritensis]VEG90342.1 methenyltetrahydrofolate cyclohydrolase [Legionella spiritensis]